MNQFKITAIIVTYFPDSQVVAKTIGSICEQVYKVQVIDNTPGGSEVFKNGTVLDKSNIELSSLGENVGIARAQNIGIQKAIEDEADFIWLSDQDTSYPDAYADRMIEVYSHRIDKDSIATIVPAFVVPGEKRTVGGFMKFEGSSIKVIRPERGCHEISQAIASGMIIPAKVFGDIGLMREDLFIDAVDSEWSWRARAKGYKILGCADIIIEHQLGDKVKSWWKYSHDVRPPIRDYYIIRNGIYLALRSKDLSPEIKHFQLKLYLKYIVFCIFFGTPHWKHFWYSFKGLYHGVTGQLGQYK